MNQGSDFKGGKGSSKGVYRRIQGEGAGKLFGRPTKPDAEAHKQWYRLKKELNAIKT